MAGSRLVAFFQLGIFILFLLKETGCDPSSRSIKIQIWLLSGKHTNIAMESHLKVTHYVFSIGMYHSYGYVY